VVLPSEIVFIKKILNMVKNDVRLQISDDYISLEFDIPVEYDLKIRNSRGRLINTLRGIGLNAQTMLNAQYPGIYFIQGKVGKKVISISFLHGPL